MAGKNQIIGGAFQDFEGNVLANGYITMELSHDEQESVDPGEVVGGCNPRVPLDAKGNIAGTVLVWPNDQLNPANSYYTVNAYRRDGVRAWLAPQYQSVPSSPSPFNVGNWVPNNPPPASVGAPVGSILLQNNGTNNESQAILNLESTDSTVVITDEGNGNINLQAKATSILLQNNGTNNASQTKLNLESTDSSVTITDEGSGNINLQAATAILLQNNGTNNSSQSKLNLESTDSSVTITDEGSGNINLQAAKSILLQNNGSNNSSQTKLNLESTNSSVTITDEGSGNINLEAQTILLQNNGTNNSSQSKLNLESTDNSVGITDEGSGNINLHVSTFGGNTRTTATISQSITAGAVYQGTVSMAYSFMILQVAVDVPCRIELYSTQAAANADLARPPGQPLYSTEQSECICDILLNAATGLTWILAPAAMGFDGQAMPTGNIFFNLTNNSGVTQTVTVTLTFLPLET